MCAPLPSGTLSPNSAFSSINFLPYPFPFFLCGFQTKPSLLMCVVFSSLYKSSLRCPLYFMHLVHSLLLPTDSLNSQVLASTASIWNPLPSFSHFSPKDYSSFPSAHYFSFPFIVCWNFSSLVHFPFHDAKGSEAICIDRSIRTRRVTFFFLWLCSLILVTNLWKHRSRNASVFTLKCLYRILSQNSNVR